jgi:hypothetical protein
MAPKTILMKSTRCRVQPILTCICRFTERNVKNIISGFALTYVDRYDTKDSEKETGGTTSGTVDKTT